MFNLSGLSSMRRRCGVALPLSVLLSVMGISVARAAQPVTDPMASAAVTTPDPSRTAYSASFSQTSGTGSVNASFGTVPDGKRLVIENESFLCTVSAGYPIIYAYVLTSFGRTYLLLQKTGSAGAFDYYEGTFTSTIYADPTGLGTADITFFVQAPSVYNGTPALNCNGAIEGHTVPHR